ncbi:MAG: hypothetical protein FWG50_04600 [Kiritimatiellaeota bacterium]|nr:hypothetical protein [Kiritimatiellota bacterium]
MRTLALALLLAAGCAARPQPDAAPGPPARAGHSAHTLASGGYERSYGVYAPPGYTGTSPLPLVVLLHGGGGTGRGALRDTNWQPKADAEAFLVAYPDALARDPSQPARFRGNPQTWNDGSGRFTHGDNAALIDDVAFLDAMLDGIIGRFAVDEQRIYVTGFSNGGAMTFRFGAESRRRIAAIAPVAGACWDPHPKPAHPVPLCYVTGASDPLNPLGGGIVTLPGATRAVNTTPKPSVEEMLARWCRAAGATAAFAQHAPRKDGVLIASSGHPGDAKEIMSVVIPGHGHYWPGGARNLPQAIAGPCIDTFDATAFIWDFFSHHRTPQPVKPNRQHTR